MNNQTNGTHSFDHTQRNVTIPILIISAFPALICFLSIFYYSIKLRKRLIFNTINNHVIFLILIFDFLSIATELPITLYYLAYGNIRTIAICTFWIYWDYTLQMTSLFLTVYASIERYFLIFHRNIIRKHEILFHYIPLLCCTIYIPILYLYFIVFLPCVQHDAYNINAFACGGACYLYYILPSMYDAIANLLIPCCVLLVLNLLIIIRAIRTRRTALRTVSLSETLKKNRQMILQLLAVSLITLITWIPWVVVIFGEDFILASFADWFMTYILHYLPYITISLSPCMALIGLPEIRKELKMKRQKSQITPN